MAGKQTIIRRLLPLYIAMCLQNFVLWYAIEKLFMTTIGFDNSSISIMAAVYAATMLLFETPSGLLADRWSRKGVLIIAGVALALASLIAGLSHDIPMYIFSAVSWGIFYALYSGTFDSIVYDTLVEETGSGKGYEKYSGRMHAIAGIALAVSSLLGGFVGATLGLRETYFITIPVVLLSIVALLILKEPTLHKAHEHVSMRAQVKATFKAISTKGVAIWLSLSLVIIALIDQMIFEFNQFWLIALAAPIFLFGPANALLLLSVTIAGFSAKLFANKRKTLLVTLFILLLFGLCLALVKNIVVIIIATFVIAVLLIIYEIVFNKLLHDRLQSNIRAGAVSAVSSISKLLFIPTSLAFGFLSQAEGVFHASWIIVGLIIILALIMSKTLATIKRLPHIEAKG